MRTPIPARSMRGMPTAICTLALLLTIAACGRDSSASEPPSPTLTFPPSPSQAGSPTATSPTAAVSPSVPPRGGGWAVVGSFGSDGTRDHVSAVASASNGVVAVGTHYLSQNRPIFGPPGPHEGRVWLSEDGREWADATPPETFGDVELQDLFVAGDGAFVAIGLQTDAESNDQVSLAWESADGRTWTQMELGAMAGSVVVEVEHGAAGYLALVAAGPGSAVWWSVDGRAWELVREPSVNEGIYDIGAGAEGFVAVGTRLLEEPAAQAISLASADGREWYEGAIPAEALSVTPVEGDWLATGLVVSDPEAIPVWRSTNGLEWVSAEGIAVETMSVSGDVDCQEYLGRLLTAEAWVVLNLTMSYPCSEGAVETPGRQLVSTDASAWQELLIGPGASVADATRTPSGVVLVGHTAHFATVWLEAD